MVRLGGLDGSLLDSPAVFCSEEESWPSFAAKIAEGGAVVEELLAAPGMVSPSVQLRILPGGVPLVLSTHSQVLGGPNHQVYLGCRFPADPAYRTEIRAAAERVARVLAARGVIGYFGVDFFVVPDGNRQRVYLAEINLRVGGTTHPFGMAVLATEGRYDAASGHLVAAGGAKSYLATDNLKSGRLVGCRPGDVIDEVARRGLAYDHRRRRHLLALARHDRRDRGAVSPDLRHAAAEPQVHAVVPVQGGEDLGHTVTEHPVQGEGSRLEDRHGDAVRPRRRGDLQADPTGADDHQRTAGLDGGLDPLRLGHVAQVEHTVEVAAGHLDPVARRSLSYASVPPSSRSSTLSSSRTPVTIVSVRRSMSWSLHHPASWRYAEDSFSDPSM